MHGKVRTQHKRCQQNADGHRFPPAPESYDADDEDYLRHKKDGQPRYPRQSRRAQRWKEVERQQVQTEVAECQQRGKQRSQYDSTDDFSDVLNSESLLESKML